MRAKTVSETLYVLNETYDSYVELNRLATEIEDKVKNEEMKYDMLFIIKDLTEQTYNLLPDDFLSNVGIVIGNPKGRSKTHFGGQYFTSRSYLKHIRNRSARVLPRYGVVVIHFGCDTETIVHEIQHAYDNYRSNRKYFNTKSGISYLNYVKNLNNRDNLTKNEKYLKLYSRSSPEKSAYFVSTIHSMNFFYTEHDEKAIRPLNHMYNKFKFYYPGYEFLSEKDCKILARKFSQYYHRIKEDFEKNKK